jgi:RNA-directed DNA polymerase
MKRLKGLWSKIITDDNLWLAYKKAKKGKSTRYSVAQFSFNVEQELLSLKRQLVNEVYYPGDYRVFSIKERKKRIISAAPFCDRVVHHAIMNILTPLLEARFYYHSYACLKNKGVHKAVNQYQQWSNQYAYVLKLDIARYFPSIDHLVLKTQLRRIIKETELLNLLDIIIDSAPCEIKGKGLPIGNLTSQYFANLYLNELDHWLTREFKQIAYLRYVDDFFILSNDKAQLWQIREQLSLELEKLGLKFHSKKQQLMRTTERVDILGYIVGKEQRWLRNDNGFRFNRKLKRFSYLYSKNKLLWVDCKPSIQSWIGHAIHADTLGLRTQLLSTTVFKKSRSK